MSVTLETPTRRRTRARWPAPGRTVAPRPHRTVHSRLLTDPQWARLSSILVGDKPTESASAEQTRRALEGVLWTLRNGKDWEALPASYPSASTCRSHWRMWIRDGSWLDFWRAYVASLNSQSWLTWSRALVRAGDSISQGGRRSRSASARYAWWLVSARVFLWEAPWVRSGDSG